MRSINLPGIWRIVLLVCSSAVMSGPAAADEPAAAVPKYEILKTPGGERFGLMGQKGQRPSPTLLVFASTIEGTLGDHVYCDCGLALVPRGVLCVALDLPAHGPQRRDGEADGIAGWRQRLDRDEPLIAEFNARIKQVLDYLVEQGYTDPARVAACGTSRGGFVAMHYTASDERIRAVASFAPLTDLSVITEFVGAENRPAVRKLDLVEQAAALAGRPVWLIIGNQDARVSTDHCVALARRLAAVATERGAASQAYLLVLPAAGHRTPTGSHDMAAVWLAEQLMLPRAGQDAAAQSK